MKKLFSLMLAVVVLLSLAACGSGDKKAEEDGELKTLNVGTMANYIGAPAYYAQEKGFFKDAGLDVNLILFDSGAPINEALAAKEIDIGQSGFASIYSMSSDVCTWVMEVDNAYRQQRLFCNPNSPVLNTKNEKGIPGSSETLKGIKSVVTVGTTSQFLVEQYIGLFGLNPCDIVELNLDYSAQYQAFISGEADLMPANGVSVYDLEDAGYVNVGTFEDIVSLNLCDGVIVRNELKESYHDEIVLYIKCIQKAMDELAKDDDLRFEYLKKFYADRGQKIEDDVLRRLSDDTIYMSTDAITADGYKFAAQWGGISDFLMANGKFDQTGRDNVDKNISVDMLKEATGLDIAG